MFKEGTIPRFEGQGGENKNNELESEAEEAPVGGASKPLRTSKRD